MLDSVAHNAGFVAVRPTRMSRAVYQQVKRLTGFSRHTDDQTALNTAIRSFNRTHRRHGFNAVILDTNKYVTSILTHRANSASYPLWDEK